MEHSNQSDFDLDEEAEDWASYPLVSKILDGLGLLVLIVITFVSIYGLYMIHGGRW